MASAEIPREIMTPEQVAEYLQINKETVYRYIRDGKLVASKLGRTYRIPRASLEMLLFATRTRSDIPLRTYSRAQVDAFMREDALEGEAARIAQRFASANRLPTEG